MAQCPCENLLWLQHRPCRADFPAVCSASPQVRAEKASRSAAEGVVEVEPGEGWTGLGGSDLAGKFAASASEDGAVCVWSLATGACVRVLVPPQPKKVWAVAHLGGAFLATGGDDKTLRAWDVAAGCEAARAAIGDDQIRSLAALPAHESGGPARVAVGTVSGVVGIWALLPAAAAPAGAVTLQVQMQLRGHDPGGEVKGLAVMALPGAAGVAAAETPAGGEKQRWLLASCSWDMTLRLWDVDGPPSAGDGDEGGGGGGTGREAVAVLRGHKDRVVALAAVGPGRLASIADDLTLRFWGVSCASAQGAEGSGGGSPSPFLQVDWRSLAIVDRPHSKDLARSLCDAGGGIAASGGMDSCLRLFAVADRDLRTSQGTARLGVLAGHKNMVRAVAAFAAPEGERRRVLVSGSLDHTLRVWDVQIPEEGSRPLGRAIVLKGHAAAVLAVTVFGDETTGGGLAAGADAASSAADMLHRRREGLELIKGRLEALRGGAAEPLNSELAKLTVAQLRAVIVALDASALPPARALRAAQLEAAQRVVAAWSWAGHPEPGPEWLNGPWSDRAPPPSAPATSADGDAGVTMAAAAATEEAAAGPS